MANEYCNKVVLADGRTLIDLTGDDATASDVLSGKKFHLRSGAPGTGACTYDSDTTDANAVAAEILSGKTAYVNKAKITGTMPNRESVTLTIEDADDEVTIPAGYHDGGGKAKLDSSEKAKIIAGNIKAGVEILGVTGTYSGESINVRSASATPTFSSQTILPGTGYDYLSQVTVAAIQVIETDNDAGGKTVTIGNAA